MLLQSGQEVERYRILGLLGEGGMAEVYRVKHGALGTTHALKVLTVTSRTVRERLVQEGRLQATLRHPNIVAVTDVLFVEGTPALLMEFIEGPSMERWLLSYRPTLDEALAVFHGIVSGVRHAHNKGLIHRDLKPANVLMHIEDGAVIPKVADFGLAKLVEGESGMGKTRSGTTMGTPAYMAPEQIRDASKVDQRADVFSLGCILYELVCGQQPFVGEDIITIFTAVSGGQFIHPRDLMPELDPAIEAAILGCLEVNPERRIPDCKTLMDTLMGEGTEGAPRRVSMPTILPEDAPGAVAARSLITLPSEEPLSDAKGPTWMASISGAATLPAAASTPLSPPTSGSPPTAASASLQQGGTALLGAAVGVAGVSVLLLAAALAFLGWQMMSRPAAAPADAPSIAEAGAPATDAELPATPDGADATTDGTPTEPPADASTGADARPATGATSGGTAGNSGPSNTTSPPRPTSGGTASGGTTAKSTTGSGTSGGSTVSPPPPVEPPAEAPRSDVATVVVTGDAQLVTFEREGRTYRKNDPLPAGTYDIKAMFGGAEAVAAGRLTVVAGEQATVKCVSSVAQCKKR